ncbi:MAG TPA: deoxyribonuclease V [Candidatus Limnocylindrales bacterium]|nr:deoxyribonuclease V [Candidatus Limnocylindrales bacterium]
MDYLRLHRWRVTPREAARIQLRMRERVELADRLPRIRCVAGADLAYDVTRNRAIAGVVIYKFPEMEEIERVWAESPVTFPYVPGLLSFREIPALLKVFRRVRHAPDLIFYDGHGYAHPRRFGIACHLGVLLDRPTIGCAKSLLVGTHGDLPRRAGSWTLLRDGDEILGAVLRTRDAVHPIYVTQGHRISLQTAVKFVSAVLDGYRIPRPTRDADRFVAAVKRGEYPHVRTRGKS